MLAAAVLAVAAEPAPGQSTKPIWSATMTVGRSPIYTDNAGILHRGTEYGWDNGWQGLTPDGQDTGIGSITSSSITHQGATRHLRFIATFHDDPHRDGWLFVGYGELVNPATGSYKFCVDGTALEGDWNPFRIRGNHDYMHVWRDVGLTWSVGDTVSVAVVAATQSCPTGRTEDTGTTDQTPTFDTDTIPGQTYTRGTRIPDLTLPEASGGDGALTYRLTGPDGEGLPGGLSFDAGTRKLTGTPTAAQAAKTYTYTATDGDATDPDSARLAFAISVLAPAVTTRPTATVAAGTSAVTEGTAATFTVTLSNAAPAGGLTVNLTVSESASGDFVAPGDEGDKSVTFAEGDASRTYSVATDNDVDDEDDGSVTVTLAAGTGYNLGRAKSASVTVTDDDDGDSPGVRVSLRGVTVSEAGGTATYTAVLATRPAGDVTVTPSSSDISAATVSGALAFTPSNWDTPQTVTVTGVDDDFDNAGDRTATISHEVSGYGSVAAAPPVTVTVTDDDVIVGGGGNGDSAGVTVSPQAVTVGEDRGEATYTVVLRTRPAGDVTVTPSSSVVSAAKVSGPLTFTPSNWDTPQAVNVSGVDDDIDNGADRTATVSHTVSGGGYGGVAVPDVAVIVADDDHAGVTVGASTVAVDEDGGEVSYTVVLDAVPEGQVTVTPSSSVVSAARVSGPLTFTPSNWYTPQTVTVSAVNDDIDNAGDRRTVTISHTVSGGGYGGVAAADVSVTVTDDDVAGITIGPDSLTVAEDGGEAAYTVVLQTEPTGMVTVAPVSSEPGAAAAGAALTFTPSNWDTPQAVTVTGVNDDIDNAADRTATVSHQVSGGGYGGVPAADVSVTVADDDVAGIAIGPDSVTVAEDGGEAAYTVVLHTEPTGRVTVTPVSSAPHAAAAGAALTFTPSNWDAPQTLTVSGVNDDIDNAADRTATVSHTVSGGGYGGVAARDVAVTVADDDLAGITIEPDSLAVAEDGGEAAYTVVLHTEPTGTVTVTPSSSVPGAAAAGAALTFTPSNWDAPQTLTVSGVNDDIDNAADRTATVSHTVSGGGYGGVAAADISVTVADDDVAGITIEPDSLAVAEDGGEAAYTVVLDTEPTGTVTVTPVSSAPGAAAAGAALAFTPSNWRDAQTVTVTGVNDDIDNAADRTATVSHTVSGGGYGGVAAVDVTVTVADDDVAGITIEPDSVTMAEGEEATFTVRLDTEPAVAVTIGVTSGEAGEATATPAQLEFTGANWDQPQTVTVTAVDDDVDDGDRTFDATLSAAASADALYRALEDGRVSVTTRDDDTAGIAVGVVQGRVTESGGTASFTVVLNSRPTAAVTVPVSSADRGEATVSPASLEFAPGDWSTPQTVAVMGVDDGNADGTQSVDVMLERPTSDDGKYGSLAEQTVTLTVADDGRRAQRPTILQRSLAAFARSVGTETVDAVGRRMGGGTSSGTLGGSQGGAQGGSHMIIGGRALSCGEAGLPLARCGAGGLWRNASTVLGLRLSLPAGFGALRGALGGLASGGGAMAFDGATAPRPRDIPVTLGADPLWRVAGLLARSSFQFSAGGSGEDGARTGAGAWTFWGRGAAGGFEAGGGPGPDGEIALDGSTRALYLGADYRLDPELLAGLAVSRHTTATDFTSDRNGAGSVKADLTNLLPYAGWSPRPGTKLWGVLGGGLGSAEMTEEVGDRSFGTDLTMGMAALGVRQEMTGWWALKADAFAVRIRSGEEMEVAGLTARARRVRVAPELTGRFSHPEGYRLTSRLELGVRYDGSHADSGLGAEAGAEFGVSHPGSGLSVEARGRTLLAHQAEGFRDWGAAVTLRMLPGGDDGGLSFSVSPEWGNAAGATGAIWSGAALAGAGGAPGLAGALAGHRGSRGGRLAVHAGYSLPLTERGRIEPFGRWTREGPSGYRLDVGTRLSLLQRGEGRPRGLTLAVDLFGEQHAADLQPLQRRLALQGSLGFR